jgi:enediyne biosynthesis protein E4
MFPVKRVFTLSALLAAGLCPTLYAQSAAVPPSPQGQKPSDASRAADVSSPHQVQLDDQHRVITAGGFVKSGPVIFQDVSEKAGLSKWTHKMGTPAKDYIIETKGSGVCLIDYDNDGWLDI